MNEIDPADFELLRPMGQYVMSNLPELRAKYMALRVAAGLPPDLPPPPDLAEVMARQRDRTIAQWHRERAMVRKIITDAGGDLSDY